MRSDDLIIPDVYGDDARSHIGWLQEHLAFTDEYLAQLVGARPEAFSEWKRGGKSLTRSQVRKLKNLHTAISRLLSYYGFRRDLMLRVLEVHVDDIDQTRRTSYTPPWVGTSLRDYLLRRGGIAAVDAWIQKIKSANCG